MLYPRNSYLSLSSVLCPIHRFQQPIPKLQSLNFRDFLSNSIISYEEKHNKYVNMTGKTCSNWSKKSLLVDLELVVGSDELEKRSENYEIL